MPTKLTKPVIRETALTFEGRTVIVELEAPGYVGVRLKGLRQRWRVPAPTLYQMAVQRHVEENRPKGRQRKVRRGLL